MKLSPRNVDGITWAQSAFYGPDAYQKLAADNFDALVLAKVDMFRNATLCFQSDLRLEEFTSRFSSS